MKGRGLCRALSRSIPWVAALGLVVVSPWALQASDASAARGLQSADLERILEQHHEAHGGLEAWSAVETLKLMGKYTGFSKTQPFTLHRQRHGVIAKYHIDMLLGDKPRTVGWDGETAWWKDGWTGNPEWTQTLSGPSLVVTLQDAEMPTPLFDWQEKGYQLELLGAGDVEGIATVGLRLTRPSGEVETWHLDAETGLEVARDATCDEFGRPIEGRMFFDDFRTVEGDGLPNPVVIPFYTEVEWRTRHRVMEVETARINLDVDPEIFAVPPPPGMEPLLDMVGSWKVEGERRRSPAAPFQAFEAESEITPGLGRRVLEERRTTQGAEVWNRWAFDRYHGRYHQTVIDDNHGRINVLEGNFEDGRLTLSNLDTGTTLVIRGQEVFERRSVYELSPDSLRAEAEISLDGGETWVVMVKESYKRQSAP